MVQFESIAERRPVMTSRRGALLELDLGSEALGGRGRRVGLEAAIRDAIRLGRLGVGEHLPSSRALASDLGLARGTVVDAYAQLAAEGWVTSRPGAATTIAAVPRRPDGPPPTQPRAPAETPSLDLSPGLADLSSFPRTQWAAAVRKVLQTSPDSVLGYVDPQGRIELRVALAAMLGRARGVVADPDSIVIVNGYTQGLALIASVLRRAGCESIAMEDPNLVQHRDVVLANGLAIHRVPVDAGGAVTAALHGSGAGAFVVTPSHQHPLGMFLRPDRRATLLEWAVGTGSLVVEDDYDGEFRYDRQPLAALQARSPDHVIYAGTAGKALAVGLRLGWLVVPSRWRAPIIEAKRCADSGTAVIDQLVLAELITNGAYERHVRKMRASYRQRRDHLVELLAERAPSVRVEGIAAGLHAVVRLPPGGPTEAEVLAAGAAAHLRLSALGTFWHRGGRHRQAVLVSYASAPKHAFATVMERVADVFASTAR